MLNLNLCFDIYHANDKVGRVEIVNSKLIKNEVYTNKIIERLFPESTPLPNILPILKGRVICKERCDEDMLKSMGLKEYNVYDILRVTHGVDRSIYSSYLKVLMQLDMLILNTDRHTHNYGLIYNKVINRFRVPPIFDNGLSLNTNRINSAISCTLSGSFEEQVIAFGYPIEVCFKIDYKTLFRDLSRIERYYGNHYEIDILRNNLNKYKSLFELSTGC